MSFGQNINFGGGDFGGSNFGGGGVFGGGGFGGSDFGTGFDSHFGNDNSGGFTKQSIERDLGAMTGATVTIKARRRSRLWRKFRRRRR